eukprot:362226-Chlamydomonas_euryale.AAC.2
MTAVTAPMRALAVVVPIRSPGGTPADPLTQQAVAWRVQLVWLQHRGHPLATSYAAGVATTWGAPPGYLVRSWCGYNMGGTPWLPH